MFNIKSIAICLLFFMSILAQPCQSKVKQPQSLADSIMTQVLNRAKIYSEYIREYEADIYVKGTSQVYKKNFLFRFAPDFLALDKKHEKTILEVLVNTHYTAPNKFRQNIIAMNGNSMNHEDIQRAIPLLNINIYNPTSLNDEVLMPFSRKAFKYYEFTYEGTSDSLDQKIIKIKVKPKQESQKLISGYIYVVDGLFTISNIDISGFLDFSSFRLQVNFGMSDKEFLLPLRTIIDFRLKLLGNQTYNHYTSAYTYTSIKKYQEDEKAKINYDLTDYFSIQLDSLPVITDSVFWEVNRPFPLTKEEQEIYTSERKPASKNIDQTAGEKKKIDWSFTKGLVLPKNFSRGDTYFQYSGLLNPFKIAFTGIDGMVYWQQLNLRKTSKHSKKELNLNPEIGFVFKRKEIYFKLPAYWLYNPQKMGFIGVELGNRNQSYNSVVINDLEKRLEGSAINFDSLGLEYYKHYYATIKNQNELFNGFLLDVGADYHLYKAVKSGGSDFIRTSPEIPEENLDIMNEYRSFAPYISLTWTPKQYYRTNEKRKEYLWSNFPTLSAEYSRGINGIFKSNSEFERIEVDIQQKIDLGLLCSFQYYAGVGKFTNTHSVYFADFRKFAKRNFPESWNDGIGGVFHLLDGNWYNASNAYIQTHAMYESPLLILQTFKRATRDIFKERFYFSQLYMPSIPYYTELGYGIGNYIFNAGVFFSFKKYEFDRWGVKFAFEL